MAFLTELVVDGIQYPADLVAADEQTLYLVNIQSTPGGPHAGPHASGQVLRIDMPNAPESMAGASATPVLGGLANPAYLARARSSGRMVVQCYGGTGNADGSSGNYGVPWGVGQALREVPDGGAAWDTAPPGEAGTFGRTRPEVIVGPRGVALSPDGSLLYVWENEGSFVNDYIITALRAVGGGTTPETMWQSGMNQFACFDSFSNPTYLKIDPAGNYLWVPGESSMPSGLVRIRSALRGAGQFSGCSTDGNFATYGSFYRGVAFSDPLPGVDPAIPTPGYLSSSSYVYRFREPAADGSGFRRFDYRSPSPYTTGETRFYSLQGLAVTPGGQVFVSCGDWGAGGMRYGNHLALGTGFNPGCVFRVVTPTPVPEGYAEAPRPFGPTEMTPIAGWNSPALLDDHSTAAY